MHRCLHDVVRVGAKTATLRFRMATKVAQAEGLGMHEVFLRLSTKLCPRAGMYFRDFRLDGT